MEPVRSSIDEVPECHRLAGYRGVLCTDAERFRPFSTKNKNPKKEFLFCYLVLFALSFKETLLTF